MNTKTSRRQKDIKSKLMAAIAMLLVSSIMMVSTTYAWFTLSTAPEVTGITTAVGANGNLEMVLLNPDLQGTGENGGKGGLLGTWGDVIASSTEDSMDVAGKELKDANITWGNLVDLRDNKTYGLNNINLYPSKLNVAAAATPDNSGTATVDEGGETPPESSTTNSIVGKTIGTNPLQRPVYGSDGRVSGLSADTLTASYSDGTFSAENAYGVRAVGTASKMTARQLAYRTAINAAATATSNAKSAASGALYLKGNALAGMAIKKAGGEDSFTKAELEDLKYIVDALANAHDYIEDAMIEYTIAHNLGAATVADEQVETIKSLITGTAWASFKTATGFNRPNGSDNAYFDDAYDKLATSRASVKTAQDKLTALMATDGPYTWENISPALNAIMNYELMRLCDVPIKDVAKQENGVYVNLDKITPHIQNLQLQMPEGSGVLADIADFCGEYTASITFAEDTTVIGFPIGGFKATMVTNDPHDPVYLPAIRADTTPFAGGDSTNTAVSITDFYGYIIDLGFRTNASNSNLLLQTKGVDRIYDGNTANDETMGAGSSMTFRSSVLNQNKVIELMKALRVVFFETDTKVVLAEARLDPATQNISGTGSAGTTEGTEGGTAGNVVSNAEVTMELYLWDPDANTHSTSIAITPLAQNTAKAVSVLVYLDGTTITNADVAATGSQSMTGTMNLQFASSAELTPMEYSDLKNGKTSEEGAPIDLTNVKVDANTATQGYAVEDAKAASFKAGTTTIKGFGVSLNKEVPNGDTVTATINGTVLPGVKATVNGLSGYAFAYNGTLAADTEITISVTKANNSQSGNTPVIKNVESTVVGEGYTVELLHVASGSNYNLLAVVKGADDNAVTSGITVKIGDKEATYGSAGAHNGWVVEATETVPTETVTVTVAVAD